MTLYELTKAYGAGKGEEAMWNSLAIVSDAVEKHLDKDEKHALMRSIFGAISDRHYTEEFAKEDVKKMYYTDKTGVKHYAPYWDDETILAIYEDVKASIPHYNKWDFYVTFQMTASDNWRLLHNWYKELSEEAFAAKVCELTVNWLNDEDNPFGRAKIWCYLNK